DDVVRAQARNCANQKRLASLALADFASYLPSQPFVLLPFHHLQNIACLLVGEDIQERRLLKLHAQSLFQRVVKGGIACGVDEISENDGVFLCEAQSFPAKIEACDACSSNKKYRSNSEQDFPADLSSIISRNESTHARREHEPNSSTWPELTSHLGVGGGC